MAAVLALALLAPLAGLAPGLWLVRGGAAVSAVAWALVAGRGAELGRFHARPTAAVVAAGVALVLATRPADHRRDRLVLAAAAPALMAGTAAGLGDPSALPLAVALLAAGLVLTAAVHDLVPGAVATAGAALLAAGLADLDWALPLALGRPGFDGGALPAGLDAAPGAAVLVLSGALVVATAAALWPGRPAAVLLAPALAVAIGITPFVRPEEVVPGVAAPAVPGVLAPLAALTLGTAWAGRVPLALGLLAVTAAAAPGAPVQSATLLAAAAVLAAALDTARRPALGLLAVPGAAALAPVLVDHGGPSAALVGVALTGTAALLAWRAAGPAHLRFARCSPLLGASPPGRSGRGDGPPAAVSWPAALPAVAAAVWLVLAPTTWGWAVSPASPALDTYAEGARLAAAGAAGGAAVAWQASRRSRGRAPTA
jgi:hypothetical protein